MSEKKERADAVVTAIEKAIGECGVIAIRELPKFEQAIRMAGGIRDMRAALTDDFVKHGLMPLMGTTLGFLTDKDKNRDGSPGPGYPLSVVRDCAIEAMVRGFNVVGNEFNIIADRFYGTKNGYSRLVSEFPGLTDLALQPGVPVLAGDRGALVPFTASWRLNGKPMSIECIQRDGADLRLPIKVNGGMGPDAILGKAERKMLFRIYQRINGSAFGATDGDVDDAAILTTAEAAPLPLPTGAVEGKRYSLRGKKQSTGTETTPVASTVAAAQVAVASHTPPSAPAPAAATEDIARLVQMLKEVDTAWDDPDHNATSLVLSWTNQQRDQARAWANAVLTDAPGTMAIQSNRPEHTVIRTREPGED